MNQNISNEPSVESNISLERKKLHLERQLLRLRAAYLGDSDERPHAIIEEIFYDTYYLGEGTPESPAFNIRWDSPLAHIVSYSTAKLVRIHPGDKHADDVLSNMFMWFSSRERFLKIREDYMLNTLYQLITYNGTKGGTPEINEIFQIESRSVRKTPEQIRREMEQKEICDESEIPKTFVRYFRLQSTDELEEELEEPDRQAELDPVNKLLEQEKTAHLMDLCNEIQEVVKRWIKKNGYDYDSFIEDVLSSESKLPAITEHVFTRMGAHWTRKNTPLRREIETLIKQYTELSRSEKLLSCMSRFLTARKLIVLSFMLYYRGDWWL